MSLYQRFAGTQLGSSAIFGGSFFAVTLASGSFVDAATAGSLAAASWLAAHPLLKRIIEATARA